MPLANTSVNLAGQTSKVGGTVARVFGWITLVVGTMMSLGTAEACNLIAPDSAAPYILGIPMALITFVVSYLILKGGKKLEKSGADTQKATRTQAVFALANTRGGMVTPADLAQSINVTPKEADDMLTVMAKESPDHVSIEVDDNGTIYYRFAAAHWTAIASNPANWERPRGGQMAPNVAPGGSGYGRAPAPAAPVTAPARVDVPARVAETAGQNVRVDPRDPLDDDLEAEPDAAQRQAR
jgi:hypothetical protein